MEKLIGKWQMVCWKINTDDGWCVLNSYRRKEFCWDFRPDGTLIETIAGRDPTSTVYGYDPPAQLLTVDRSVYADDGFLWTCIEEHYRVEFLSDRYCLFYDLEQVEIEPDDYILELEMEKTSDHANNPSRRA